ncbi:hypothetical protein [Paenibacillus pinistramenti]|uniref:hypothetical protein n=1 Tax=Paenibacillus pinistramenti TaxID=1768003 RepID=UPI001939C8BF|nr:hypothetical protein [Paenibacillus pinistramenti]
MNKPNFGFTKITVTVNGKPVGSEFLIDKETYVPVAREYVRIHDTAIFESRKTPAV